MTTIGDTAPRFALPRHGGHRARLSGRGHEPTVVVFTCNHCPYALAWHERLLPGGPRLRRGCALSLAGQLQRRRSLSPRLLRRDEGAGGGRRRVAASLPARRLAGRRGRLRSQDHARCVRARPQGDPALPRRARRRPPRARRRAPRGCATALDAVLAGEASGPPGDRSGRLQHQVDGLIPRRRRGGGSVRLGRSSSSAGVQTCSASLRSAGAGHDRHRLAPPPRALHGRPAACLPPAPRRSARRTCWQHARAPPPPGPSARSCGSEP